MDNNTGQRCFAQPVLSKAEGAQHARTDDSGISAGASGIGELDFNDRWGLAY
jgi:hypothetical protein